MGYFYIAATIFFTVYGQLALKYRMNTLEPFKDSIDIGLLEKILHVFRLLLDPWIFSGFFAAFIASFFWILAMSKFEISYAYPFMSSAFVLVLVLSYYLFSENLSMQKIVGMIFIVLGIIISSRSI